MPRRPESTAREWRLPLGLIVLAAIPFAGGVARLAEVNAGTVTPENARLLAVPAWLVVHIVSSLVFSVVGALQFVPALRRKGVRWHRNSGRVMVACGLVSGVTALWMNQYVAPGEHDGALLYWFRVLFGVAMTAAIAFGYLAILQRDVMRHRVWMARAYAIGQGAGTQALLHILWLIFFPMPQELGRAWLMGAGWFINVAIVEWAMRRPRVALRTGVANA